MALSSIHAALASATNEVTIAAAKINFDFTLVKNEAPKEYQALGETLSSKRRSDAEAGRPHITARRLGALFEGVCPPTPKLQRAYGIRVSEMCRVVKEVKEDPSAHSRGSPFSQYLGVDGTSIWAAATSSSSAIQVQLLACMLARMFDAPEAISVWAELVRDRRAEIASRYENNEELHYSVLTAATQAEISRAQLAEWDASARAWLRTADGIKIKQQKQLMLILDNLDVYVSKDIRVYSSVLAAWKASIGTMESLIGGAPQAAEDGAAILGLSSWHIYPNMVIMGCGPSGGLDMSDPLVAPGGTLTVGIEGHHARTANRGIYWSLSLAHLKFYGQPILQTRELSSESCRLTFDQFSQAALGALLAQWSIPSSQTSTALDIILAIAEAFERGLTVSNVDKEAILQVLNSPHWFHMLYRAARRVKEARGQERDEALKLMKLGERRSDIFAQGSYRVIAQSHLPFFDLKDPSVFIKCLQSSEERLRYLRVVASRLCQDLPNINVTDIYVRMKTSAGEYNFATAIPSSNPFLPHERWITRKRRAKGRKLMYSLKKEAPGVDNIAANMPRREGGSSRYRTVEVSSEEEGYEPSSRPKSTVQDVPGERCHELLAREGKPRFQNENDFFLDHQDTASRFNFVFGISSIAGIFIRTSKEPPKRMIPQEVDAEDMLRCLKNDKLSVLPHRTSLLTALERTTTDYLLILGLCSLVFGEMKNPTLDVRVLDRPIADTKWGEYILRANGWSREAALACIAYFETGQQDVAPGQLQDVFAMSCGDSIYIPSQLLCDPWQKDPGYKFRRILGNVGRSGVTMLVSPETPDIRKLNPGSWRVIANSQFNNLEEDHFGSTSLHLTFTQYCRPLDFNNRGQQDVAVELLEAFISVHESGRWVADIDILRALASSRLRRLPEEHALFTSSGCCGARADSAAQFEDVISLENWDAILDLPKGASVVRARGNSLARVALVSVLNQLQERADEHGLGHHKSKQVLVLPPRGEICIRCLTQRGLLKGKVVIY